ncbi:type VI secretion system membrane subunit TssM [Noviherbaspirillum humi]|nr:type VI secretion system membrane subunit TssM [Noviherbaspirillum humi]
MHPKVISVIGMLLLLGIGWFLSPYIGVTSKEYRFLIVFCIMLVWVAALMMGRALTERAGGALEKFLRLQADEAVISASHDRRAEITRLRQRMLAAIDTLKSSQIGRTRGRAALYELPWYMIIGHPAAGKSSAILRSGLTFPLGDRQIVQGVGGTRDCDWFFSTEGVLLDTAGRYATQREDRSEWLAFLRLLKKYRPRAPVNGVLVSMSFPELQQFQSEQFSLYARQMRERIDEIEHAFGMKVPVYLIFTKVDLLGGFAQFFEGATEEERQQVWGATLPHEQPEDFDARSAVLNHFDILVRGLTHLANERLAQPMAEARRAALFSFPIEFNGLREAVGRFAELLFQNDTFHARPLLRGFYFTSALQEGLPRIAAGARVAARFHLSRPGFEQTRAATSCSYFLRGLFQQVLFPDQFLVTRQGATRGSRARITGIAAGIAALACVAGALAWSYIGNHKLIEQAAEERAAAAGLLASSELADRLKALQVLQLRLEQLDTYRRQGHPMRIGLRLYQGEKIEKALRADFFAGMRLLMLEPISAGLEQKLSSLQAAPAPSPPASGDAAASTKPPAPQAPPRTSRPVQPARPSGLPVIPIFFDRATGFADARVMLVGNVPAGGPGAASSSRPAPRTESLAARPLPLEIKPAARNLDDGYNALKTYLMLGLRERMDAAHLADQLPRYWRPWLEANRGKGNMEDISRLAERLIGFYLSQLDRPDLPLITPRGELVAASRTALRGAMSRLSAKERVYNELKSRANTQFVPLTLSSMLAPADASPLAASRVVQGAFTREAWEKYFRGAIESASKGVIKGDDWVLATMTQDDLAKEGSEEKNRRELEALYKADYQAEWAAFLQGVTVREAADLNAGVQAFARLSQAQQSPIHLLLQRAVQETSWDNPSQLSRSLDQARKSVIERTEQLILGTRSAPAGTADAQLGETGRKFQVLHWLSAASNDKPAPLAAYFDALGKIRSRMAQIAASGEAGASARQWLQATLAGSGSELADALNLVDAQLLAGMSEESRSLVRPLLVRPLMQAYALMLPLVEQDLNQAWQADVLGSWRGLASKYPFADSASEATLPDIAKFLKPKEGILARFIDKNLSGLVMRRGEALVPRTWAGLGINFNPAFLSGVARFSAAASAALQEGEASRFELQPVPTPGLSEISLEIDGQAVKYRNGPQIWTGFSWPGVPEGAAQGARIQTVSFSGAANTVAGFDGRLGLLRLLAAARNENPGAATVQLEWRHTGGRGAGEKATIGQRPAGGDGDAGVVRFNFRMVSGANPLAFVGLRNLALPDKVALQERAP